MNFLSSGKTNSALKIARIFSILLLSLIFFSLPVGAVKVNNSFIEIKIDKTGFAKITENIWLAFEGLKDMNDFANAKERNQTSITAWNADYEWFNPNFGNMLGDEMRIKSSNIIFEESESKLILEYELAKPFAELASGEARVDLWKIPDKAFSKYIDGGTYRIPENTTIKIILPDDAQVRKDVLSQVVKANENTIELGGTTTKNFGIQYEIKKPISSGVDGFSISSILENRQIITILAGASLIILALLLFKGKEIEGKIENYIVNHTELKKEEEVDSEVDI